MAGNEEYLWKLEGALKRAEVMQREQAKEFLTLSRMSEDLAEALREAQEQLSTYRATVIRERIDFMRR